MKPFIVFAALLAVTSAGLDSQVPSEIYQAMEFHHSQDHQGNGISQGFDGGYQGHQVAQNFQHQPVQHHNIQTHHVQSQPQHIQFQSQPQHFHEQSQPQHVHFQSESDQGSHIGHSSSHIGQSSSQISQLNSHIGHSNQHSSGQSSDYQHSVENQQNKEAKILNYQRDSDEHNYQYAYETENGIKVQEVGSTTGEGTKTQGAYSYTGDDGQVYTVTYTADENGFHPSGAHLPTPPPVPEEIARSIEHNLRDEANGIVDDGHYRHEHDHQEQYTQQSEQHHQKQQPSHGLFQQLQRQNYEPNHQQQQQPSIVVQQVQQQKQEQILTQPKQQPSFAVFQQLKQQNLLQQAPQHVLVQQVQQIPQKTVYQQQPLPNMFHRFQRHQKPVPQKQRSNLIRQQQQSPLVHHQQQSPLIQQQVLPHVEEHRHVEYVIPTFTRNFRKQVTDDYVGPAPAPVTEDQYL